MDSKAPQGFHLLVVFLIAVFLSNVPEAIASSMGMHDAGFSNQKIFGLWGALVVAGVVAAALGNIFRSLSSALLVPIV